MEEPKKSSHRKIELIAAVVFSIAALLHLWRLVAGFQFVIGSWTAPMWISLIGVLLAGTLAVLFWKGK